MSRKVRSRLFRGSTISIATFPSSAPATRTVWSASISASAAASNNYTSEARRRTKRLIRMPDPTAARQLMVDSQLRARGISDPRVLDAMARVPRHEFVPEPYRSQAYEDHPLPIGDDQTISQPYVVALMLESLQLSPEDKVLEVGTGSGYVTALLAELAAEVFSIERHASLAESARTLLVGMGYANACVVTGDGALGLAACAPFDAILVSAAALRVPP